jgi:dihydroorotate dehydrogenase
MYNLIKKILFLFNPEKAHKITFLFLKILDKIPLVHFIFSKQKNINNPIELFGLKFKNPVGLAAGLDKDAEVFDILGSLGFGFVEIGTVTPLAQPGNPAPRLFRIIKDKALINRMGFNNKGLDFAVKKLKKKKTKILIGGNIGKNKVTPNENAIDDYLICFNKLYDFVDYFAINISSPNTPNLRELQEKEPLRKLLKSLVQLNSSKYVKKPILLKIAPDLNSSQLDDIIEIVLEEKIDGIIATNTTIERNNLSLSTQEIEIIGNGGLSGKPLTQKSTEIIKYIFEKSGGKIPIIASGGVMTAQDALEKLNAGASLIQIYSGFIYEGPKLIKEINIAIKNKNT